MFDFGGYLIILSPFIKIIVEIFKSTVSSNIFNSEIRKIVTLSFTFLCSIALSFGLNEFGGYKLSQTEIILLGSGAAFPVALGTHRIVKLYNEFLKKYFKK